MKDELAAHFATVARRPTMYMPQHTLSAASAYVMGVTHDRIELLREFNRWFGHTYHGRPELAFWGAITEELTGSTSSSALDALTDEQNRQGVERLFTLLEEFLVQPGSDT